MNVFPNPTEIATPLFLIALILEIIWARSRNRRAFEYNDVLLSLTLGVGGFVSGILLTGAVYYIYSFFYQFKIFGFGYSISTLVVCFVGTDLSYYCFHRSAHRVRWFWANHVVHHSSQYFNFTTALRQTWMSFFALSFIFRIPLTLIGFDPAMIIFCDGLNLIYQFWVHTESIKKMPRWFEFLMNTPSHHRVHHSINPNYLDKNYAGTFIIWDRMFGTFTAEREDDVPRYGIVKQIATFQTSYPKL